MSASDSEERSKQVRFTQDMVMKKTHTIVVVIQEATATIAAEGITTNREETVTHVAEATIATAEVEETTPATTTETVIATQEVRQRHLLGPEEEVIEATIEIEKATLKESQ